MKSDRYKLELEVYGNKDAIDAMALALYDVYTPGYTSKDYELEVRIFPCNFSPKRFWKMCNLLEKRFWKNIFKKDKK